MKKGIVIIIVFVILAITFTATMIKINKSSNTTVDILPNSENSTNIPNVKTNDNSNYEKTLDLRSFYDENSIIFEEKYVDYGTKYGSHKVFQISGLKNKDVESKINNDIKDRVLEIAKETGIVNTDFSAIMEEYDRNNRSFANVFSVTLNIGSKSIDFNYELVNGERLKILDLFTSKTSLEYIMAKVVYKRLAANSMGEMEDWYSDIHYDSSLGEWRATHYWYDYENEEDREEEVTYTPPLTDYEITKEIKRLCKNDEYDFYFNTSEIRIDGCPLYFQDMPSIVTIYDKYLTKESIYEDDSIGKKGLIVCNTDKWLGDYKETKFESDNYFYDVAIGFGSSRFEENNYPIKEAAEKVEERAKEVAYRIVNKYKDLAQNQDKGYILLVHGMISPISNSHNEFGDSNILCLNVSYKILECDRKDYDDVLDDVLKDFRYYNLAFYGESYNYVEYYNENNDYNFEYNDSLSIMYDALKRRFFDDIEDLFVSEEAKNKVIRENTYNAYDSKKNYTVVLSNGGLEIESDNRYEGYIDAVKNIDYLNITIFSPILDSSDNRIAYNSEYETAKRNLQYYNSDILNKAYNEIFARHGHDFKNKELKDYFSMFDWYKPVKDKVVSMDELTDIEKENAEFIIRYIREIDNKEI